VKVRTYRDLEVWQVAYDLCRQVYQVTARFPKPETYGLVSQLRRAAVSVPSNIAEGMGRRSTPEFLRSLRIAYGSNCELETQLLLARDLGYVDSATYERLRQMAASVERMMSALDRALRKRRPGQGSASGSGTRSPDHLTT